MRAVIIQPHFLPFMGYFDLMRRADCFVFYDSVQFRRRSWHCRTWIHEQGQASWLSAPVSTANGSRRLMNEVHWDDSQLWRRAVSRRLRQSYSFTQQPDLLEAIDALILSGPSHLVNWNILAIAALAEFLGIKTLTLRSSQLPPISGEKQERLVKICREIGASSYLCGPGSKTYVSDDFFLHHGIKVEWMDYNYEDHLITTEGVGVYPSIIHTILMKGVKYVKNVLK
ncbi:MAG: WbqC family protein [Chloracidobacterium sp.]|nr:WbqC family protein [Chloracidobacterium sp.]